MLTTRARAVQVATPALLPLPGPHGHYRRGYGLVLFLNSRGEVTAYHPYGERAWQARAPAAYSGRTHRLPPAGQQPPQHPCCGPGSGPWCLLSWR
jgi:hypothetical protein